MAASFAMNPARELIDEGLKLMGTFSSDEN
jgi:hypothetical protein